MVELLLLIQQVIASSTHLVAKNITTTTHPATVVLWRGAIIALASTMWLLISRRSLKRIEKADYGMLLLLGMINMPLNQLAFIWGVKYTTPANTALAYALTPAFVVLFQRMFYGDKPSPRRWLGIAVAFVGAAIVLVDRGAHVSAEHTLGNMMVLGASASWAVFTMVSRPLAVKYGGISITAWSFVTGLITFIPTWFFIVGVGNTSAYVDNIHLVTSGSWTDWGQLIYLALITSGVGYALWIYALARMDSARVAVFNNIQPIITTLMMWVVSHQSPSAYFLVGGLISLLGVTITQRSK